MDKTERIMRFLAHNCSGLCCDDENDVITLAVLLEHWLRTGLDMGDIELRDECRAYCPDCEWWPSGDFKQACGNHA